MFSFRFPSGELIFLFNAFPVIFSFFRFQFCPGNVHIEKGNILAEWKRELAYEKFAALDDEAVQNVEAVICNNDDMALGVYDYYKEKNLKLPVIIGINNSEEMHQKIMSGEMYGTIDNKMEDQVMEICRLMQAILKKDTGSYQKVWYSTPKAIVKAEGTE